MVNKDEKTKTYCVICSFDNMFVIAQKLWWLLMCINVYHDVTDVLKFADSPKDIIFWLRHQKYFVGVFSMVHLTSSDSPKLLTPHPPPPHPLVLSTWEYLWKYPEVVVGTFFHVQRSSETTLVFVPDDGEPSWLLLPSLVSLLSKTTRKHHHSCIL